MKPTLEDGDVHVWRVLLDAGFPSGNALEACLSADERARAERFRAPLERHRFVASRTALRHVLSLYHGVPADALPVLRESGGRPFVEGAHGLSFSLTHSGPFALVAVAGTPVGIDLERVRDIAYMQRIARRILHESTVAVLEELPEAQRAEVFITAWTQKEAHVKAVGGGMFRTADDLPLVQNSADDAIRIVQARTTAEPWSVIRFRPGAEWRAAVVARGTLRRIVHHEWRQP